MEVRIVSKIIAGDLEIVIGDKVSVTWKNGETVTGVVESIESGFFKVINGKEKAFPMPNNIASISKLEL